MRLRFSRLGTSLALALAAAALCMGLLSPSSAVADDRLQFTGTTLSGAPFNGASLQGKPAVLWFWAPWCPICQGEAPGVAQVAHSNPGVSFVGVAAQDQVPAMQNFVAKYQLGFFPQLADVNAFGLAALRGAAQPAFAFVSMRRLVDVVKNGLSEPDLAHRVISLDRGLTARSVTATWIFKTLSFGSAAGRWPRSTRAGLPCFPPT